MPVQTTFHPEYSEMLPVVTAVRDACGGDPTIKAKRELYLPADFAKDEIGNYTNHYIGYINRAYFLGVTGRTKESMIGMVFRKEPTVELPPQLEAFSEDIDGAGQSLEQISKEMVGEMLEAGKYFLLVDYPQADENTDSETEARLGLRPTIATYRFENLINWHFEGRKGRQVLTRAVLKEFVDANDEDEFSHLKEARYRVLRLRDGVYTQQLYDQFGDPDEYGEYIPRMAGGAPFDHIPLHIAGAKTNLPGVDMPPLYDVARANIAHYQTTANVMESGYVGTQPMLHVDVGETDLKEWAEHNPGPLSFGNRHGLKTKGGKLEVVQANATDYNREVKEDIQGDMVALGAQLVQRGGQAETAEAARIRSSAESSVLDVVVGNASECMENALEDFALFLGAPTAGIEYRLNDSYWESGLSAQDLQAVTAARQMGSFGDRDVLYMIRQGRIQLDPAREDDEILEDAASGLVDNLPDEL